MSTSDLPEELIREILSLCLTISPTEFFRFPTLADHPDRTSRTAGLLLVSKQWLRIGAPLLYASLKLSDASHATAVAALLAADPSLGAAVTSLCIEGDCGAGLAIITKHTPRVARLYLSVDRASNLGAAHLAAALAHLRPRELCAVDMTRVMRAFGLFPWARGTRADDAVGALERAVACWTTLERVRFGPCFVVSPAMSRALELARVGVHTGASRVLDVACCALDGGVQPMMGEGAVGQGWGVVGGAVATKNETGKPQGGI
ncbi:hypothetical protein PsYK624_079520 [Phanerochaete sordida]|uniref:F-box domain-containing protein n=1 Tax=Phanerochaete sordida TaxID=48140 RepID=A0A9P3GBM9_9APHY|nr:hypothetical protein PsYK624_079520 [Phanerochaete sordida]